MSNRTDIVVETDNAEGQVLLSASRVYDLTEDKTQDTINGEIRNTITNISNSGNFYNLSNENLITFDFSQWKNGAYNTDLAWVVSPKGPIYLPKLSGQLLYAFWDGVDFTKYPDINFKVYTFDASGTRLQNINALYSGRDYVQISVDMSAVYMYVAINTNNGSDVLPVNFIEVENIRLYIGFNSEIDTVSEYDALYAVKSYPQGEYKYLGNRLPLDIVNRLSVETLPHILPDNFSTIGMTQGMDIYNGYIFQIHQNGTIVISDFNTGAIISTISGLVIGHGNCCQFGKTKVNESDFAPLLYVSSWQSPYSIYAVQITANNTASVVKTYRCGTLGDTGSKINFAVDEANKIVYAISTKTNSTSDPTNNYMIVQKFGMPDEPAGDGIYWLQNDDEPYILPFINTMQDTKYHNGHIFVLSSASTNTDTQLYVINANVKAVVNIVEDFPPYIKNNEMEGLAFDADNTNNRYNIIIRDTAYNTYKVIT